MTIMTAPRVRVRAKHQITLPAEVARAAGIGVNDVLDVSYKDGVVSLMTRRAATKKRSSVMDWAGSMKGTYGDTTAEQHAYIANERASWER